jgi:hypothetical protein
MRDWETENKVVTASQSRDVILRVLSHSSKPTLEAQIHPSLKALETKRVSNSNGFYFLDFNA